MLITVMCSPISVCRVGLIRLGGGALSRRQQELNQIELAVWGTA